LRIIYKISPDPSLLKRGTQLGPDIFITPPGKGAPIFPPFSTTLFVIEPPTRTCAGVVDKDFRLSLNEGDFSGKEGP
jgi:hypothetical protein